MTDSRYQKIAGEIAERIRCGELGPGQPIPSTRQIVREWGVAMATATRAIAVLKSEGLVDAVPGHGTLVRARIDRPSTHQRTGHDASRMRGRPVGLDDVLTTAIRIADEDGLEFLTMRRLAGTLGIPTMSLYQHVPSKHELVLRMTDSVFDGMRLPVLAVSEWRRRIEAAANAIRVVFAQHSWAADTFSLTRPQIIPNLIPIVEWNLHTLLTVGLTVEEAMHAHINLFALTLTAARTETAEERAEADTGQSIDAWADAQTGRFPELAHSPALAHVIRHGFDYNLNDVFDYGLQRMLDGIAASTDRHRGISYAH